VQRLERASARRALIDRTWLTNDPGHAELHTIEDTIPPGGQVHFTYRPSSPLPQRNDGHCDTSVSVISLVEIQPSTATARRAA
jgi:hypothetical protein